MNTPYHFVPDLAQHIASPAATMPVSPNIQGRAVYADARLKVLLLPFRAGQTLAEHTTPHEATMHVLRGDGHFVLGRERQEVHAGSWVQMARGLPHSIEAVTDLLLLLQVLLDPDDVPARSGSAA